MTAPGPALQIGSRPARPTGAQLVEWIELVGHGHVLDRDDRGPKDGRHVYSWKGGKLIER